MGGNTAALSFCVSVAFCAAYLGSFSLLWLWGIIVLQGVGCMKEITKNNFVDLVFIVSKTDEETNLMRFDSEGEFSTILFLPEVYLVIEGNLYLGKKGYMEPRVGSRCKCISQNPFVLEIDKSCVYMPFNLDNEIGRQERTLSDLRCFMAGLCKNRSPEFAVLSLYRLLGGVWSVLSYKCSLDSAIHLGKGSMLKFAVLRIVNRIISNRKNMSGKELLPYSDEFVVLSWLFGSTIAEYIRLCYYRELDNIDLYAAEEKGRIVLRNSEGLDLYGYIMSHYKSVGSVEDLNDM